MPWTRSDNVEMSTKTRFSESRHYLIWSYHLSTGLFILYKMFRLGAITLVCAITSGALSEVWVCSVPQAPSSYIYTHTRMQ